MSRLLALYPNAWRDRYELEVRDLLAMRPPTIADRVDLVRGALDAQLRDLGPRHGRVSDPAWKVVLAGLGAFLLTLVIAANGTVVHDDLGTYREGAAALPFLLLAMLGLVVGLVRILDQLPPKERIGRAMGWVAVVGGLVWVLMPWMLPVGATFLFGVLGMVVGARRARLVPAWSELVLVALLVPPIGLMAALSSMPWWVLRLVGIDLAPVLVAIALVWPVTALMLRRGFAAPEPVTSLTEATPA